MDRKAIGTPVPSAASTALDSNAISLQVSGLHGATAVAVSVRRYDVGGKVEPQQGLCTLPCRANSRRSDATGML